MSEFKEKLKYLLNHKDNKDEIIFNSSLRKIHTKIRRENSANYIKLNLNNKSNHFKERSNSNKYEFKFKKSKSNNNIFQIIKYLGLDDIHKNKKKNFKSKKIFTINSYKSISLHSKRIKYNDSKPGKYPFQTYINNIGINSNLIPSKTIIHSNLYNYKENIFQSPINKSIINKTTIKQNSFRIGIKPNSDFNYSNFKNTSKNNSIRHILLNNKNKNFNLL